MGFRCTFITGWPGPTKLPAWFIEKWKDSVNFSPEERFPLSCKQRTKANWNGIVEDIQKVLEETDYRMAVELVFVHECSGVTRVEISRSEIIYSEPIAWKRVPNAYDHYIGDPCYDKSYQKNSLTP